MPARCRSKVGAVAPAGRSTRWGPRTEEEGLSSPPSMNVNNCPTMAYPPTAAHSNATISVAGRHERPHRRCWPLLAAPMPSSGADEGGLLLLLFADASGEAPNEPFSWGFCVGAPLALGEKREGGGRIGGAARRTGRVASSVLKCMNDLLLLVRAQLLGRVKKGDVYTKCKLFC